MYPSGHTGIVKLYKYGVLTMKWEISNGKRIGNVTVYDNGCVVLEESWDSIFGDSDPVSLVNTMSGMKMSIEDSVTHHLLYFGDYNSEMKRHGYGIEFDSESGQELFEGKWENGELSYILRTFEDGKMIEYKEDTCKDDPNQCCPVYIGGYRFDEDHVRFMRHGDGCLLDEHTRTASRRCKWEMGKEVSGVNMHGGLYSNHVIVTKESELASVPWNVNELSIESKCFNRETSFDFSVFSELRTLTIGSRCFKNINAFAIDRFPSLQWIKIEEESFTRVRRNESWDKDEILELSCSFSISNCPLLRSIDIGPFSFMSYGGKFELSNLPALTSVTIGDSTNSSNFYYADLFIQGTRRVLCERQIFLNWNHCSSGRIHSGTLREQRSKVASGGDEE